jgi:2-polyprenyl-3-methyl-5-hydroxy-6-metoxy-1,4-benzoquinol methylase
MTSSVTQALEHHVRRLQGLGPEVAFDSLPEPQRTYVDYAMSTIQRGRWALEELVPHGLSPGFRLLDAGCAYGGYLAAAAELGAREVVGVEIEEKYLEVARDVLAATGTPATLLRGSLSDDALLEPLGTFDVVTCADVIEHVDDVPASMANLCRAVAPGGMLYLAVPNAWSPKWVRSDPHFQLFGITLLDPQRARDYHHRVTGSPGYGVGEYHRLDAYERWMRRYGLEPLVVNGPTYPEIALGEVLAETERMVEESTRFADPRLPADTVAAVRREVDRLAAEIRSAAAAPGARRGWRFWRRSPGLWEVVNRYWIQTWHVLGRRPA